MTDYQQKQLLLAQLTNWWTSNGWNPATLKSKSLPELLRIRTRAQSSNWRTRTQNRRHA